MGKPITALVVFVAVAFAAIAAEDPFAGMWQLNVAKSKFSPGPPPKSATVTVDSGSKVSVQEVSASGENVAWSFTPKAGGPSQFEGTPDSSVVETRANDRAIEHAWEFGDAKYSGKAVLSKDGKTMTFTMTWTDAKGQRVHNVEVYDKQ